MSRVDQLISAARGQLGVPYVFGAERPGEAFDCSGLTSYVFGEVGVKLPHKASEQQRIAKPVAKPLPGDLVFWGNPATHVALYIGGGKVISAPHTGSVVKVQDLWGNPTFGRVAGLGTATAGVVDAAAGAATAAGGLLAGLTPDGLVQQAASSVRGIVIKSVALLLGVGLLGTGLILTTRRNKEAA